MVELIAITDAEGAVVAPQWLPQAEAVHRQLRPGLPADYVAAMREIFRDGGRMWIAVMGGEVAGVAVYRFVRNTHAGLKLYVDDLVTHSSVRSQGVGRALLGRLELLARERQATSLDLDSGTQRHGAHRFYFREGFVITSFSFKKALT